MSPIDRLVAENCWAFDDRGDAKLRRGRDCSGPVKWRTYPESPNMSFAMCEVHWQQYGPDGPAGGPDGPVVPDLADDNEQGGLWWGA